MSSNFTNEERTAVYKAIFARRDIRMYKPTPIPSKSLTYKKIIYEHPIFNAKTNEAQSKMIEIQGKNNIFYAGAWLKYGFHEDGIASAVNISKTLNVKVPWEKRN